MFEESQPSFDVVFISSTFPFSQNGLLLRGMQREEKHRVVIFVHYFQFKMKMKQLHFVQVTV
jgi:hypothetical protein